MSPHYSLLELPYEDNLGMHYAKFSHCPGFVLLESCDVRHGRYDILSAYPYARFRCERFSQIPEFIQQLEQALPNQSLPVELPFQGGLIGYFSYEFGASMCGISTHAHTILGDIEGHLADFGLYDWAIIADHVSHKVWLFAAHRDPETKNIIAHIHTEWHRNQDCPSSASFGSSGLKPRISESQYKQAFDKIWQDLAHGRCYQVNFTQPFEATWRGELWQCYEKIRAANPVPYAAYLHTDDQTIVSFSPERFLSIEGQKCLASPIKGTAARSSDPVIDQAYQEALSQCKKNRAENTMIVDLWRNDLSKISMTGTVHVSRLCGVESYASVHHLVSTIESTLRPDVSLLQAFLHCFPAGSITGAPKLEAMQMIYELEAFARGVYCGSIAYFSAHGKMDSNIAIRTLVANKNSITVATGGGIVINSDVETEYAECFVKLQAFMRALQEP